MSAQAIRLTDVDIDNALAGHLDVVFQPVHSMRDGALMRVETFVRWDHPGLGLLPPGAFISFFEAQGRMGELTRYVLAEATKAYTAKYGTGGPGYSVNLAQSDVADPSFAGDLACILSNAGLPPSLVTLECPPFAPDTAPADAALMLSRLARTGCPLAAEVRGRVGDVLSALDPFPFAEVKTGGAAILRFARTAKGGPGLSAISELLDLAKTHGARAVAVGVEDAESAQALATLGFDGGQGKLFGGTGALGDSAVESVNEVRASLGLDALGEDALAAMTAQPAPAAPAKLAPLILGETAPMSETQAGSLPDDPAPAPIDAGAPDPTMLAIMRLKAKKIAAKKAALKRAEADKDRSDREAAAALQASDTARRLQERLASELEAPLPQDTPLPEDAPVAEPTPTATPSADDPQADDTTVSVRESNAPTTDNTPCSPAEPVTLPEPAPVPAPTRATAAAELADDAEAGVLLSQNLAEIALGVSRQTSFAEGIRMDGYAPSGGGAAAALQGAVAPEAAPEVRRGEAEPAPFVDIASAIHDILAELPVPEDVKPRLIQSAEMPLANRGAPPAAYAAAANVVVSEPVAAEDLTADLSAEDTLDAVVATLPELNEDTPDQATLLETAPVTPRPRRRRKTNLLTRKYRITHFWPRSWVRALRRYKAARAVAAEERIGDAEALAA